MVERFRRYWADTIGHPEKISSGQKFTDILNLRCGLDLECSNPLFQQDTPAYDAVLPNPVWLQMTSSLEDITEIVALTVTLTLNTVNQFFCMTLWLIMLHNHTRFGDKMFWVQKISSGKTLTNIWKPRCDLDLECSNPIFQQDIPAYDVVLSKQVWLQTDQHFRRCSKNSDLDIEDSEPIFRHDPFCRDMAKDSKYNL